MLIRCPDCGWKTSSDASHCPNCGVPIMVALTKLRMRRIMKRWRLYSGVVGLLGLIIVGGQSFRVALFEPGNIGLGLLLLGFLGVVASLVFR